MLILSIDELIGKIKASIEKGKARIENKHYPVRLRIN